MGAYSRRMEELNSDIFYVCSLRNYSRQPPPGLGEILFIFYFPARSDHSLRIQKVRTPGIERHQHYSNCLDRNKYNRCICAIRGYDMSLSLCSLVLALAVKTSRFRSKGFYKDQPCSVKNVGHLPHHSN